MVTTLNLFVMLRSNNEQNFIRMGEQYPHLLELVNTFDLVAAIGAHPSDELPQVIAQIFDIGS